MNHITQLTDKAIACVIPPEGNINNSYLWGSYNQHWIRYTDMPKPGKFRTNEIKLPEGAWEIVGIAKNLSEEQWKEIVGKEYFEDDEEYFHIYEADGKVRQNLFYDTATESGLSLLKSKGLNPDEVLILLNHKQ